MPSALFCNTKNFELLNARNLKQITVSEFIFSSRTRIVREIPGFLIEKNKVKDWAGEWVFLERVVSR